MESLSIEISIIIQDHIINSLSDFLISKDDKYKNAKKHIKEWFENKKPTTTSIKIENSEDEKPKKSETPTKKKTVSVKKETQKPVKTDDILDESQWTEKYLLSLKVETLKNLATEKNLAKRTGNKAALVNGLLEYISSKSQKKVKKSAKKQIVEESSEEECHKKDSDSDDDEIPKPVAKKSSKSSVSTSKTSTSKVGSKTQKSKKNDAKIPPVLEILDDVVDKIDLKFYKTCEDSEKNLYIYKERGLIFDEENNVLYKVDEEDNIKPLSEEDKEFCYANKITTEKLDEIDFDITSGEDE